MMCSEENYWRELICSFVEHVKRSPASNKPFFIEGSAIKSLLFIEAYRYTSNSDYLDLSIEHLSNGMEILEKTPLSSSFYDGICGFGWLVQSFPESLSISWRNKFLTDLDVILAEEILQCNNLDIDIINGLAGIVIYGMARSNKSSSSKQLWKSLDKVTSTSLSSWLILNEEFLDDNRQARDLGVAHGIPGLLSVASVAWSRGFLSEDSKYLIEKCFDKLWQRRITNKNNEEISFPSFKGGGRSRLAWCYGGLGLAVAFSNGAAITPINKERAQATMTSSINQYLSGEHGIEDPWLCHGYIGAALSFHHFSRNNLHLKGLSSSLNKTFLDSMSKAEKLITVSARKPSLHNIIDYAKSNNKFGKSHEVNIGGLLDGPAGFVLAGCAMYAEKTPKWMEILSYF